MLLLSNCLQIQSKTRTRYIAQRDRDSPSNQAGTKRRITLVRGTRGQHQQPYIAASCKASRRPKLRTAPQNTVLRLLIGDCGCQGCTPGFMNVSVFRHVTSASQANFVAARVRLPSSWRCRQSGGLRIQTHTSYKGAHEAQGNRGLFIPARTSLGEVTNSRHLLQKQTTANHTRAYDTTS